MDVGKKDARKVSVTSQEQKAGADGGICCFRCPCNHLSHSQVQVELMITNPCGFTRVSWCERPDMSEHLIGSTCLPPLRGTKRGS